MSMPVMQAVPSQELEGAPEGFKMFVGGLNWDTTVDGLKAYFSKFGPVTDCTIMKHPQTGRSRGFGFVSFQEEAAIADVLASGPHNLDGRNIDPKRAVPKSEARGGGGARVKKIFCGGLPPEANEQALREFFSQYGQVDDVVVQVDRNTGRPRGFGFVNFGSEDTVEKIVAGGRFVEILGKWVEVKKATPKGSQMGGRRPNSYGGRPNFGGYGYGGPNYGGYGGYRPQFQGGYYPPGPYGGPSYEGGYGGPYGYDQQYDRKPSGYGAPQEYDPYGGQQQMGNYGHYRGNDMQGMAPMGGRQDRGGYEGGHDSMQGQPQYQAY
jgi:RNA recognition motif-containing protein